MIQQPIETLVTGTLSALAQAGFTTRSLHERELTFAQIVSLHKENQSEFYDPDVIQVFCALALKKYQDNSIGKVRYRYYLRTAAYLTDYQEHGELTILGGRIIDNDLNDYYNKLLLDIQNHQDWNDSTKRCLRQCVMPYLKWLQAKGHESLSVLSDSILRTYLMDISSRMTVQSLDTTRRMLKKFHLYAFSCGLTDRDYTDTLSFTVPTERHIQKPIPHEEISAVLDVIDRNTKTGKRDYAIILLAVVLGLRSIDIVMLCLENIDWVKGELRFEQTKTGKSLALPLTKDIGKALQDYILNARPESEEPYIFLRIKSPSTRLGRTMPYQIFNTYTRKAGMTRKPFHALRRTLGTSLVIEGVPVTTVAQILGHSSIEPTKQYISLDSLRLKECALSLEGLPDYGGDLP